MKEEEEERVRISERDGKLQIIIFHYPGALFEDDDVMGYTRKLK
jgi:hypothetical protein